MNIRSFGAAALILLSAVMTGCATSRSEVRIAAPVTTAEQTATTKQRSVVVRSVTDERVFESAPRDPSVPSLGIAGAGASIDATKARAIGRKRNGFGQALGDVLLQDGQTVPDLVRDNVEAAFRQAGYGVTRDAAAAGNSPVVVDVRIRKFWSWFQPGFWAITLHADIETDVIVASGGQPTVVKVAYSQKGMVATDSAWIETVDSALKAYRAEAAARFSAASF